VQLSACVYNIKGVRTHKLKGILRFDFSDNLFITPVPRERTSTTSPHHKHKRADAQTHKYTNRHAHRQETSTSTHTKAHRHTKHTHTAASLHSLDHSPLFGPGWERVYPHAVLAYTRGERIRYPPTTNTGTRTPLATTLSRVYRYNIITHTHTHTYTTHTTNTHTHTQQTHTYTHSTKHTHARTHAHTHTQSPPPARISQIYKHEQGCPLGHKSDKP